MMQFTVKNSVRWPEVAAATRRSLSSVILNKVDDKWEPIKDTREAKVQFAGYGDPLTEGQIKKLSTPMK